MADEDGWAVSLPPPLPPKVCATCCKPLDVLGDLNDPLDTGRYVHQHEEWGQRTHVVIPVAASEVEQVADHCDFCYAGPGAIPWTVVCEPFAMEIVVPTQAPDGSPAFNRSVANYSSLWAACNDCEALIRRKRWGALASRVIREGEKRDPRRGAERSFFKDAITTLYDRVEVNFVTIRGARLSDHDSQTH